MFLLDFAQLLLESIFVVERLELFFGGLLALGQNAEQVAINVTLGHLSQLTVLALVSI